MARVRDSARSNYVTLIQITKGAVLAVFGVTLIETIATSSSDDPYRLFLWAATALAIVLTYEATMTGTIMTFWTHTPVDDLFVFAVGGWEVLLIAELGATDGETSRWFLLIGAWALTASLFVMYVQRKINPAHYVASLAPLVSRYKAAQRRDARSAMLVGLAAFASAATWWATDFGGERRVIWIGAGLVASLGLAAQLLHQSRLRASIADSHEIRVPTPPSASPSPPRAGSSSLPLATQRQSRPPTSVLCLAFMGATVVAWLARRCRRR